MILYQITDGSASFDEDIEPWLSRLSPEADFIQIREKHLNTRDLTRLVRCALQTVTRPRILVNDRADVALACGAAGVHLPGGSVAPERIKQLGPLIVTAAWHRHTDPASLAGADYLLVAPVFTPMSKPADSRPTLGLAGLANIAAATATPVLALGGISPQNASSCIAAGAAGIAGIGFFAR